jgi:peptidoglycan/LPS O-acetylase OafA/YrhL
MTQPRFASLDVLRFFAILFVLLLHGTTKSWVVVSRFGWTGVDLFFVLSGFLVAGLLLDERKKRGQANVGRFLVRRGFKIYPSFWAFLAATLAFAALTGRSYRPLQVACELLFLQNYGPNIWVHTWSLAVEEHFYFLLAAAFAYWQRRPARAADGLRALCVGAAAVLVAILAARCLVFFVAPSRYKFVYRGTHARIDALVFGAFLAALYHRERPRLRDAVTRHRWRLLGLSALGALPVFVLGSEHAYTRTVGFTFLYLFYGAVLLATLFAEEALLAGPLRRVAGALAAVGRHSYGIYLWHPLAIDVAGTLVGEELGFPNPVAHLGVFLAISIAAGVALSHLIEEPFLALRERLVPRATKGPLEPPAPALDRAPLPRPGRGRGRPVVEEPPTLPWAIDPLPGQARPLRQTTVSLPDPSSDPSGGNRSVVRASSDPSESDGVVARTSSDPSVWNEVVLPPSSDCWSKGRSVPKRNGRSLVDERERSSGKGRSLLGQPIRWGGNGRSLVKQRSRRWRTVAQYAWARRVGQPRTQSTRHPAPARAARLRADSARQARPLDGGRARSGDSDGASVRSELRRGSPAFFESAPR